MRARIPARGRRDDGGQHFGNYTSPQLERTTQVPIRTIEQRAGLIFDGLADVDGFVEEEAVGRGADPLLRFEQIRFF